MKQSFTFTLHKRVTFYTLSLFCLVFFKLIVLVVIQIGEVALKTLLYWTSCHVANKNQPKYTIRIEPTTN